VRGNAREYSPCFLPHSSALSLFLSLLHQLRCKFIISIITLLGATNVQPLIFPSPLFSLIEILDFRLRCGDRDFLDRKAVS